MQTFLPSPEYRISAEMLDRQRLGKQRVEVKQIYLALKSNRGWSNHPATRMWRGYEYALLEYGKEICGQWQELGYKDTVYDFLLSAQLSLKNPDKSNPPWLGDARFHSSHRAALLLKNYTWYSQFGWGEEPSNNYFWPGGTDARSTSY